MKDEFFEKLKILCKNYTPLRDEIKNDENFNSIVEKLMKFHYDLKYQKKNITKEFDINFIESNEYNELSKTILSSI